jgi:hypothetical protein
MGSKTTDLGSALGLAGLLPTAGALWKLERLKRPVVTIDGTLQIWSEGRSSIFRATCCATSRLDAYGGAILPRVPTSTARCAPWTVNRTASRKV